MYYLYIFIRGKEKRIYFLFFINEYKYCMNSSLDHLQYNLQLLEVL